MGVGSTTNLCRREAPAEGWGLVPQPTFAKGRPVRKVGGWFHNQPLQKGNPCGRLGVGSTINLTISNPRLKVGGWFWNQPLIKGWFHGQKVGGWGLVVAPTLNQRLVGGWFWNQPWQPQEPTLRNQKNTQPLPEALQCPGTPQFAREASNKPRIQAKEVDDFGGSLPLLCPGFGGQRGGGFALPPPGEGRAAA